MFGDVGRVLRGFGFGWRFLFREVLWKVLWDFYLLWSYCFSVWFRVKGLSLGGKFRGKIYWLLLGSGFLKICFRDNGIVFIFGMDGGYRLMSWFFYGK